MSGVHCACMVERSSAIWEVPLHMSGQKVSVAVANDHLDKFQEVARKAREAGLEVDEEMPDLGLLTGTVAPEKLGALQRIKGIRAVETQRTIRVPPPNSDVQ